MSLMSFFEYTDKSVEEVFKTLKTSENGLSKKEALLRQGQYGPNETKAKNINVLNILARQVRSPFFYLLFIAGVVSALIGQLVDCLAVIAFIIVNVAVGFFQEYRAERAVSLLQKFIPQRVKVLRQKQEELIDRKDLVPGDIVLLAAGDTAPADLRAVSAKDFLADESVLTGESLPASKITERLKHQEKEIFFAKNIIFSGTSVISGRARAVVLAIGQDTVLGTIAKNISGIKRESAYEKSIVYFSRLILKIVAVTITLIFLTNIAVKGFNVFFEILLFSVALIVSILPEALPAVVTFSLARGSLKMAKKHVVVKRLSAIEDLGNIEVLCADKTGTLTQNKLSLEEIVSSDKKKCFLYGVLSSGAKEKNEKVLNPFDLALFSRCPEDVLRESRKCKIMQDLPFDSYRMRSSCLAELKNGQKIIIVKGSAQSVLKKCSKLSPGFDKKEIKEEIEREGKEGRRVLAIAFKKVDPVKYRGAVISPTAKLFNRASKAKLDIKIADESSLTFLGYFVFEDPLKSTAKEAIELSKKLGVQIKIITGDASEVAGYVARKTGLIVNGHDIISGQELEQLQADDFDYACQEKIIFSRISPDLKYKIIKSLQKKYEVGFVGEGVNDALALSAANVGIAVSDASDVARNASDVVMLQKDLRVIVNGIKDGRMIFSNINKYIKCALASNFGNFYSIAVISVFINFLPMLPVQILLGNLLSDFPLISIATDSVDLQDLKKPKAYQLHNVLPLIISLALVSTVFDFIFFAVFNRQAPAVIQTLWFIESILTEILLIFIIRTRGIFYKAKMPSFWLFLFTIIDGVFIIALPFLKFGQNWFHFVSPPIFQLFIVFFLVANYFVISELVKLIYFKYFKPKDSVVM